MRDSPAERLRAAPDHEFEIGAGNTALLVIDMQNFNIRQDVGLGPIIRERGLLEEHKYLYESAPSVIRNIQRLLESCRSSSIDIVFIRIAARTRDGRDGSRWQRGAPTILHPEDSLEAQVLEDVKPLPGEIVLTKTSLSAFNSTGIDQMLRNMGIDTLIATGGMTPGCVELTIRDGVDRGYAGIVVSDACTSQRERDHLGALERMSSFNLKIASTDEVVSMIDRGSGKRTARTSAASTHT